MLSYQGDDQLLPLLEQHGVAISAKGTTGKSWLTDLAVNVLPMALLLGMLVFMGRHRCSGGVHSVASVEIGKAAPGKAEAGGGRRRHRRRVLGC